MPLSSVKPIVSLSRLLSDESSLIEMGATFSSNKSEATLRGIKYFYTNLGYYVNLNDGEVCLSSPVDKLPVGATPVKYVIEDNYLKVGYILIVSDGKLSPILTPEKSTIKDVVLGSEEMVSGKVTDLVLKYLGFEDLINSFVIDRSLVSVFGDGDTMKLSMGTDAELIGIGNLEWYPEELINTTSDMATEVESNYQKVYEMYAEVGDSNEEVVNKNSISDYVSIKTLVRFETVSTVNIPKDLDERKEYRIIQNQAFVRVDKKWDPSDDNPTDPYVYWFPKISYEIVHQIIMPGDLVELCILYRKNRKPSTKKLSPTGVTGELSYGSYESEFYTEETDKIGKIMFKNYSGDVGPIRFNGREVIYDNLEECSLSVKVLVSDSFLITDDFYIQVNSETINIFSRNEDVTEYYIKSCKKIKLL